MKITYGFQTNDFVFKVVRNYKVTYYYILKCLDGELIYYGNANHFICFQDKNLRIVFNSYKKNNFYIYLKDNDEYYFLNRHFNILTLKNRNKQEIEVFLDKDKRFSNLLDRDSILSSFTDLAFKKYQNELLKVKNIQLLKSQLQRDYYSIVRRDDKFDFDKVLFDAKKKIKSFIEFEKNMELITIDNVLNHYFSLNKYDQKKILNQQFLIDDYLQNEGIYFSKIETALKKIFHEMRSNLETETIREKFIKSHSLDTIISRKDLPREMILNRDFINCYQEFIEKININSSSENSLNDFINRCKDEYYFSETFKRIFNTDEKIITINKEKDDYFNKIINLECESDDEEFKLYLRIKKEFNNFIYDKKQHIRRTIKALSNFKNDLESLINDLISSRFLILKNDKYYFEKHKFYSFKEKLENNKLFN